MFRNTITKILCIMLLATLICFPLAACTREPSEPEIHTTDVIRSGMTSMFEYANFVYFSRGEIFRYNTVTGELDSACLDPECGGKCVIHAGMSRIGALEDGKLYFYSFSAFTHDVNFAYQDLISGEVTILDTLSEYEFTRDNSFVSGGYLYYYAGILKDGGDAKNYDDYETHLCRIPLSGGEREVLETPSGIPQMIIDGKLVMFGNSISLYDLDTGIEKIVWNCAEHGFRKVSELSYVNGKIFALAEAPAENCEMMVNEYTGVTYAKNTFLVSVDITTGEWNKVTEEAVESFTVTDDRVYYFPTDLRYLYVPKNAESNKDGVKVSFFGDTLYSRKHDGSDVRAEYTNEKIDTCFDYTVINGRLYGSIDLYGSESTGSFCAVDLATGEILGTHDVRK